MNMPPIPDELCGFRGCVFKKRHNGAHTWEYGEEGTAS